ncbi:MAG: galactokinase [Candidatus Hydrogenedentes bacterium]|nr:galactokinase [Candidatus Hydrogenedentota bacterium]
MKSENQGLIPADLNNAREVFGKEFGKPPEIVVRAPGRVNLIGEHTDYNHGFVLPMAIDRETRILASRRPDRSLRVYAANLDRTAQVGLDRLERNVEEPWIDYVVGVARELARLRQPLSGADLVIGGNVPVGAGLSSSASLEMAALTLFETLGEFQLDGAEAARLGQRVENEFLGLKTGIMDQFIIRMAKSDQALLLDCRSLACEWTPITMRDVSFVIADTSVARGLAASKYNERVAECGEAVKRMQEPLGKPNATHLRDFTSEDLETCRTVLSDTVFRRARHIITENARTRAAAQAMRNGNVHELGPLMNASGDSLRADYEVTCPELDAMTETARELPGCHGARMTGAGFGGCTVNLVASGSVQNFCEELSSEYRRRTGLSAKMIVTSAAPGAGVLE